MPDSSESEPGRTFKPSPRVCGPWRAPVRRGVIALAVFAVALGAFAAAYANWEMYGASPHHSIQGGDDTGYYVWLRSAVIDRDVDFANDIAEAPTLESSMREVWLAAPRTQTGRVANKYPPGWAIATLPAFLVGHAIAGISGQPTDGWSTPYFAAIWIYHLALAGLGLWWAWRVVARVVREDLAAAAVLALWIASPMIYYHTGRISMAHGLLFTLLAGVYHFTFSARPESPSHGRWLVIGVLGGLAVLVRATAVVYLIFPLVVWWRAVREMAGTERLKAVAAFAAPGISAGLVLVACNAALHGTVVAEPYPGESFAWLRPAVLSSLFSPRHGLFYWHPLILIGVAGLVWAMASGAVPRIWAVSLAAIIYINSAWEAWWFGSSFGNRAYEGVVLLAMVGLGWLVDRISRSATPAMLRAIAGVIAVAVTAGGILLILFIVQAIPREDPVTYADMLAALLALLGA